MELIAECIGDIHIQIFIFLKVISNQNNSSIAFKYQNAPTGKVAHLIPVMQFLRYLKFKTIYVEHSSADITNTVCFKCRKINNVQIIYASKIEIILGKKISHSNKSIELERHTSKAAHQIQMKNYIHEEIAKNNAKIFR